MQNLGSFRPLGAILGAPSHTKLDFAIPLWTVFCSNDSRQISLRQFWQQYIYSVILNIIELASRQIQTPGPLV